MRAARFSFTVCLLSFAFCLAAGVSEADSLAENQARIGPSTGTVQLLSSGAVDWIDVHEGVPLDVGDRIRTADDGEIDILLSGNVLWKLEPNTQLVAEHMEVNSGRFQLESGSLLGKVDSAHAQAGQHWEFDMPMAICTITGTEFMIAVVRSTETRLGVFEGSIEMQPAETALGEVQGVHVLDGQESISIRGRPLKVIQGFSPVLHTLASKRSALHASFLEAQRVWTPYTVDVRKEIRQKFVPPAPKHVTRPKPNRRRRSSGSNESPS